MFPSPKNSKRLSSENLRSGVLPLEVDREILRSVALFGSLDNSVSFFQRNQSYQYFGPQVKRQIRIGKRILNWFKVRITQSLKRTVTLTTSRFTTTTKSTPKKKTTRQKRKQATATKL